MCYQTVCRTDLGSTFLHCLAEYMDLISSEVGHDEDSDEWEAIKALRKNLSTLDFRTKHILPPTCLGQGAGSVADKLTALLHMARLEVGPHFSDYCSSVIALVTDQGTESLISEAGPVSANTLMLDDTEALKGSCVQPAIALDAAQFLPDDSVYVGRPCINDAIDVVDISSEDDDMPRQAAAAALSIGESREIVAPDGAGTGDSSSSSKTIPRVFLNPDSVKLS